MDRSVSGSSAPLGGREGASTRNFGQEASSRNGKPLCRYGTGCRQMHDQQHCDKYEHQVRPCKFGAKCRRKGRGCRFQHPGVGSDNFAGGGGSGFRGNDAVGNNAGNGNELGEQPEPARPVPFIFLMICVCALGLLVLPLAGECDADRHQEIFGLGFVLLLPFLTFEALLFAKRSWILQRFLEGDYSERATYRKLNCLWYPVHLQLLRFTSGDVAGNNIEQYATWETNDVQQQVEYVTGGSRDGGQVSRVPGTKGFQLNFPGELPSCTTELDSKGEFQGLGVRATFDGSHIVSQEGAWAKAGYWRLDMVTKVLLLLFLLGLESMFVAVSMPPGVDGLAGVAAQHGRMPLKAVFVVDGSSSIVPEMWKAQQQAGVKFIQAFQRQYGGRPGDLNIGVVQFATDAVVELPVTSDIEAAKKTLKDMPQLMALTQFDEGLKACRTSLDADTSVESFEVCVLITDGVDMSEKSPQELQALAGGADTAIFGIYVGNYPGGDRALEAIVDCGKAQTKSSKCDFFASATDYAALSAKADEVAKEVTKGVDIAMCAMVSALIGLPTAIALCLPYILWYASCTGLTMVRRRRETNNSPNLKNDNLLAQE